MEQVKFDLWCLVELFGHSQIAEQCTEQNVAGINMLRVGVSVISRQPGFARFFSKRNLCHKPSHRRGCRVDS